MVMHNQYNKNLYNAQCDDSINKLINTLQIINNMWGAKKRQQQFKLSQQKKSAMRTRLLRRRRKNQQRLLATMMLNNKNSKQSESSSAMLCHNGRDVKELMMYSSIYSNLNLNM